ncbi:hypothetical protein EB796_005501 [Bugula neritina]|uniref:Uncharacterized protein n=1 Tax=Bugula neritina TaxID=10212 RepID=A0A7J7KF00_BUGNE|nr:hypothetical protein EB796_005501 [Bugula neritina]
MKTLLLLSVITLAVFVFEASGGTTTPAHASLIAHSKQRESWWELTQALYPAGAGKRKRSLKLYNPNCRSSGEQCRSADDCCGSKFCWCENVEKGCVCAPSYVKDFGFNLRP